MRTVGSVFVVFVCALVVLGCRPEQRGVAPTIIPPPRPPVQPQVSTDQQQALLEEILEYIKQSGSTGEEVLEEIRRLKQLDQAPSGVAAIDDDLRVAQKLVATIAEAAADEEAADAATALERLRPTLTVLRSELPAAVIAQHLERALVAISNLPAQEAANASSSLLLAAIETAMDAPAPLVPEVVESIERAKTRVDNDQLENAADQMVAILGKLRDDGAVQLLDSALAGIRGAEEALYRGAWPVVVAELDQLDAILSQLQEKVGEPTGEPLEVEEPERVEEEEEATETVGEAEEAEAPEPTQLEEEAPAQPGPAPRIPARRGRR